MDYGETCVDEYYGYKIRDQRAGLVCKNDEGTCSRALCECDKQFAESHASVAAQYDSQFHIFNGGFVPEESCPPDQKGPGTGTPKVCLGIFGAWRGFSRSGPNIPARPGKFISSI